MSRYRSLRDVTLSGIASMIRDLSLLSTDPPALERAILANTATLAPSLFYDLPLIDDPGAVVAVGDVVLFRLGGERGAYPDMETLWGGRVALLPGSLYLGVVCERQSSKLITAEFAEPAHLGPALDLQLIAQGGGIGWATGFSPLLEKKYGTGIAADVTILGVLGLHTNPATHLNIIQHTPLHGRPTLQRSIPHVLCVGTATDVGKTTVMAALLRAFSQRFTCAAIKASGTGWYEDSQLHMESGATFGLSYTAVGLPTTYNLPPELYLSRITRVLDMASSVEQLPSHLLPPACRGRGLQPPDVLCIEHGGDLIEANIPAYLAEHTLMQDVVAIVICSESALSLRGALSELAASVASTGHTPRLYANMPLVNPQAFVRRIEGLLDTGTLTGVLDIQKPELLTERERRRRYAHCYPRISTPESLLALLS
ncbi:MAG TPA: hypothetical protein VGF67_24580 [Ktedonobacteraceae bacterium]|jgi:hypothetical protein